MLKSNGTTPQIMSFLAQKLLDNWTNIGLRVDVNPCEHNPNIKHWDDTHVSRSMFTV